jgi:Reverse transcriptase (RNA-dependent DNA polymerase)
MPVTTTKVNLPTAVTIPETAMSALLYTFDSLSISVTAASLPLLVSLDLCAAFDTIDHSILLNRLQHSFGFSGLVHQWLHSYLTGRTHVVLPGSRISSPVSLICSVPQGSVLNPLLFII